MHYGQPPPGAQTGYSKFPSPYSFGGSTAGVQEIIENLTSKVAELKAEIVELKGQNTILQNENWVHKKNSESQQALNIAHDVVCRHSADFAEEYKSQNKKLSDKVEQLEKDAAANLTTFHNLEMELAVAKHKAQDLVEFCEERHHGFEVEITNMRAGYDMILKEKTDRIADLVRNNNSLVQVMMYKAEGTVTLFLCFVFMLTLF